LGLYVNYRDTFKPAAIDFGIGEAFAGRQILEPETSQSVEGGLKARLFNHRAEFEASGFYLDFSNLVVPVQIGGLGGLINAGAERFAGFETGSTKLAALAIRAHAKRYGSTSARAFFTAA